MLGQVGEGVNVGAGGAGREGSGLMGQGHNMGVCCGGCYRP